MRILITGASGQLGHALARAIQAGVQNGASWEVMFTGRQGKQDAELGLVHGLDITVEADVFSLCEAYRPHAIINAAAYTAVDACEMQGKEARLVNAVGPANLANAAELVGAKLIQISTDYVFDGKSELPYREEDPVNPLNIYGKTKAEGERAALANCSRTFVVRTSWLYGEGKNFVRTMLRMAAEGKQLRVVGDQEGTPTSAVELARLILFLMETEQYGYWHGACEGHTSWYGFAKEIFRQAGVEADLIPITTGEFGAAAARPAWSVLENARLHRETSFHMPHWQEALAAYLKEEGDAVAPDGDTGTADRRQRSK